MKKKRMTKAQSQRTHALRRAWERYGIVLNREQYQDIIKMIQNNESNCVERQSIRVSIHEVVYNNTRLKVVYDSNRKTIASFLPPN